MNVPKNSSLCVLNKRWGGMIPAPVEAEKNIKNAAGRFDFINSKQKAESSLDYKVFCILLSAFISACLEEF
jgi:hypothetical protein